MLSSARVALAVDSTVSRLTKRQCEILKTCLKALNSPSAVRGFCSVAEQTHVHTSECAHGHIAASIPHPEPKASASTVVKTQEKSKKKKPQEKEKKKNKTFKVTEGIVPTPRHVLDAEALSQIHHDMFSTQEDYLQRKVGRMEDGTFADVVFNTRMSTIFNPTQYEVSADAVTVSHQLLLQAGYIKQLSSGHYIFMPLALRVLQKITDIVDEELQRIGGQRMEMPIVMPKPLWEATGRWESSGAEMFRMKDRNNSDFCLGPTHEEAFTWLVSNMVSSHNQLPLMLYQIGKKFRDEARPRGGLLRCREFVMKDLYSFDKDYERAHATYKLMVAAYQTIFSRLGVGIVQVEADSGNIGGNLSHEYHVLSSSGEDTLLRCELCGYTANEEKTQFTVQPEFDLPEHEEKLKMGPATEAMREDPRSVGLWRLAEDDAGETEEEAVKRSKIDAGVRSTVASIVKKLLPEATRNDVPMVCNLFQLKDFKRGEKAQYDANGNVTFDPNAAADPATMGRAEGDFRNLALILFRADREPNLRAIASYYDVSDVELVPAPRAALILLRFHKFKTRQHQLRKEANQLPPTHDNPFERLTTRFKRFSLEELTELEQQGPEVYMDRMRELDREVARMNIDGGMSIMVDTSLVGEQHDLDSGLHGEHPDLDFSRQDTLARRRTREQQKKLRDGLINESELEDFDDDNTDFFSSTRGTEADRMYTPLNPVQGDFVLPKEGDRCIQQACNAQGVLREKRGIEVGHVFYLGQKYSKSMAAKFTDDKGQAQTMEMGCYGLGLTRIMAAAIESEKGHDDHGIIWPEAIAPYTVYITAIGKAGDVEIKKRAEDVTSRLTAAFKEGTDAKSRFPSRNEDGEPFTQEDAYYDEMSKLAGQESAKELEAKQRSLGLGLKDLMAKKKRVVRFSPVQSITPRIADNTEAESVEIESHAWNWGHTDNPTHAENIAASLQVHAPYLRGDIVIDDRHDLTPGQRLKDATLLGFPYIVIVGRDMQQFGVVEVQHRAAGISQKMTIDELMTFFMGGVPTKDRFEYDEKTSRLAYKYDTERRIMEQFGLDTSNYAPPDDLVVNLEEDGVQYDYLEPDHADRLFGVDNADPDQVLDDFSDDDMVEEEERRAHQVGFGSSEAKNVNDLGMIQAPEEDENVEDDSFSPSERAAQEEGPISGLLEGFDDITKMHVDKTSKKGNLKDNSKAKPSETASAAPVPAPASSGRTAASLAAALRHLPGDLNAKYLSVDEGVEDNFIRLFRPYRLAQRPAYSMLELDAMYNSGVLYKNARNMTKVNLDLVLENIDLIGGREFTDQAQTWTFRKPRSILNVEASALDEAAALLIMRGPLERTAFTSEHYKARNANARRSELERRGLISPDGKFLPGRLQAVAREMGVKIPDELVVRIRVEQARAEVELYEKQLSSFKSNMGYQPVKAAPTISKSSAPRRSRSSEEVMTAGPTDKSVLRSLGSPAPKKSLYYDDEQDPEFVRRSIRSAPLTVDPETGGRRIFRFKTGNIIPKKLLDNVNLVDDLTPMNYAYERRTISESEPVVHEADYVEKK